MAGYSGDQIITMTLVTPALLTTCSSKQSTQVDSHKCVEPDQMNLIDSSSQHSTESTCMQENTMKIHKNTNNKNLCFCQHLTSTRNFIPWLKARYKTAGELLSKYYKMCKRFKQNHKF